MENASKAVIIAGGVMIALLIISLGVLLRWQLSKTSDEYVAKLDTIELRRYNSNFEVYSDREDITAQDIITAAGVAKQKDNGTRVYIKNTDITDWSEADKNAFLSQNILLDKTDGTRENLFKCTKTEYDSNGKVTKIIFEKTT